MHRGTNRQYMERGEREFRDEVRGGHRGRPSQYQEYDAYDPYGMDDYGTRQYPDGEPVYDDDHQRGRDARWGNQPDVYDNVAPQNGRNVARIQISADDESDRRAVSRQHYEDYEQQTIERQKEVRGGGERREPRQEERQREMRQTKETPTTKEPHLRFEPSPTPFHSHKHTFIDGFQPSPNQQKMKMDVERQRKEEREEKRKEMERGGILPPAPPPIQSNNQSQRNGQSSNHRKSEVPGGNTSGSVRAIINNLKGNGSEQRNVRVVDDRKEIPANKVSTNPFLRGNIDKNKYVHEDNTTVKNVQEVVQKMNNGDWPIKMEEDERDHRHQRTAVNIEPTRESRDVDKAREWETLDRKRHERLLEERRAEERRQEERRVEERRLEERRVEERKAEERRQEERRVEERKAEERRQEERRVEERKAEERRLEERRAEEAVRQMEIVHPVERPRRSPSDVRDLIRQEDEEKQKAHRDDSDNFSEKSDVAEQTSVSTDSALYSEESNKINLPFQLPHGTILRKVPEDVRELNEEGERLLLYFKGHRSVLNYLGIGLSETLWKHIHALPNCLTEIRLVKVAHGNSRAGDRKKKKSSRDEKKVEPPQITITQPSFSPIKADIVKSPRSEVAARSPSSRPAQSPKLSALARELCTDELDDEKKITTRGYSSEGESIRSVRGEMNKTDSRSGRFVKKSAAALIARKQGNTQANIDDAPCSTEIADPRIAAEIRSLREREEELRRSRSELGLPTLDTVMEGWKTPEMNELRGSQSFDHLHQMGDVIERSRSSHDIISQNSLTRMSVGVVEDGYTSYANNIQINYGSEPRVPSHREKRDIKEIKEIREYRESRESRDTRDNRDHKETREIRESRDSDNFVDKFAVEELRARRADPREQQRAQQQFFREPARLGNAPSSSQTDIKKRSLPRMDITVHRTTREIPTSSRRIAIGL